jgi:hypothetical protein
LLLRFGVFLIVVCAWCGPFFVPLLIVNERDPFDGAHNAVFFSADAFSAFVPGGANMLGRFTEAYWSKLTGDIPDQCVYVGLTVLAMAFFGAVNSFRRIASAGYWIALAMCSYGLSLGPVLHIHGIAETGEILPYAGLEGVLPLLKLSGVPSRMTVMLALALSVLLALGVSTVLRSRAKYSTLLMALFAIVMAIDLAPIHLPSTPVYYPAWTAALRDLPLKGAVISQVDDRCLELYYQTLYDRPMAFGYISRVPASVELRDQWIIELARERNFAALRRDMGFVYLVLPRKTPMPGLPIVYRDADVNIQELPG